ncbi:hypothetical protein EVAR_45350_1 [Eumeta japonica]|uniref:Uncharacterized protein n=1 Tax=Eumeta variegata TaxID=151549 RepID=A0A4C1Y0Y1_EUMVA|nr:hypothetical protein EVAR_45350_1 [Eumeta japonica]
MKETEPCCARGRPIIVEWERDARHSAGLSLVRLYRSSRHFHSRSHRVKASRICGMPNRWRGLQFATSERGIIDWAHREIRSYHLIKLTTPICRSQNVFLQRVRVTVTVRSAKVVYGSILTRPLESSNPDRMQIKKIGILNRAKSGRDRQGITGAYRNYSAGQRGRSLLFAASGRGYGIGLIKSEPRGASELIKRANLVFAHQIAAKGRARPALRASWPGQRERLLP